MSGLAVGSRFGSGNPTKDDDIQEAVAHEAVLTVNTADVFSGIYPSINAILAERTSASIKGRVFGFLFSAQQIGSMGGPILGGVIATYIGMKYVFLAAGAILLCLSFAINWKVRHLHGEKITD